MVNLIKLLKAKWIVSLVLILISNYSMADAINLHKISYPAEKLGAQTDVTISESGRIDYKNRYSNGNKWMGYHVLTAIVLKDEKGNIFHVIYEKKGLNAGYFKTEVQITHGIDQIDARLVSKIDVTKSVITHDRVGADDLIPKIPPEVFTYAKMLISTTAGGN